MVFGFSARSRRGIRLVWRNELRLGAGFWGCCRAV